MNFDSDCIEEYNSFVATLKRNKYQSKPKKLELDVKHHKSPHARPYIVKAKKLELKSLPPHLRYVILGRDNILPVIIVAELNEQQCKDPQNELRFLEPHMFLKSFKIS